MNWRPVHLEVGARSETGHVRDENQDRMSGTRVPLGHLYIVADGMGGHKGGAVAAELTVQELQRSIGEAPVDAAVKKVIQMAFAKTNETVYQRAHAGDPAVEGMGSTAVLLLISGRVARVAHVGDSRAYLYRKGRLKQLTTDHTVVQKMVQAGMLKPNEAAAHPNASVLDRAIGSKPGVLVDISDPWRLREGDAILLCSDGLSGYAPDTEIASILRSHVPVQEIPDRLINLALQKGGEDNVTVQFIQYGTRPEKPMSAPGFLPPFFQIVAALVLGATLSAVAFALYLPVVESGFRAKESTLSTDVQNKQGELDDTKKQLTQVRSERDEQREKVERLEKEIENMEKQVEANKNLSSDEFRRLEKDRDSYKTRLGSNQTQLDKTKEELTAVKKKLERTDQELKVTRQELTKTKASLEASREAKDRPKSAGEPEPKVTPESKPTPEPATVPTDDAPVSGASPDR